MRYFSPLEKQIVSALIGLKNPPENVFGMVMQPILFSKGKLALLVVNQGKNGMLLLPNRDLKTITTSMTEMVEFISLMEFLEKERLIYVQSFPMTCDVSLFYEGSSIYLDITRDEYNNFSSTISPGENFVRNSNGYQVWQMGSVVLSTVCGVDDLCERLLHYLNAMIYPTETLRGLVRNDFLTDEELQCRAQLKEARKSVRISTIAFLLSICSIVVSPIVSVWVSNHYGYSTLSEKQLLRLESVIKKMCKTDTVVYNRRLINDEPTFKVVSKNKD